MKQKEEKSKLFNHFKVEKTPPKPQKQKPPRKVRASADARGERSKISDRGEAFAPQKRECPTPLGRFSRTPFAKGVLEAAFFPKLSLQKQLKEFMKTSPCLLCLMGFNIVFVHTPLGRNIL